MEPGGLFKEYDLHKVQSLEIPLLQMDALSVNYWLTKFVEEVAKPSKERYPPKTLYQIVCGLRRFMEENNEKLDFKAGSHVRRKRKRKRKRKHKEVHTSNANASTVQYASAIEYSKMVDEVDVLEQLLLFFLFLCLRRIRRRRLIQRNNKSRPKRLWVREIFQKRQLFPFLSQHLPF